MPEIVIDREKAPMYFDTSADYSESFASFYETYMESSETTDSTRDFNTMADRVSQYKLQGEIKMGHIKELFHDAEVYWNVP